AEIAAAQAAQTEVNRPFQAKAVNETDMGVVTLNKRRRADCRIVESPYDNDLDQDELNRIRRKPGEPGYLSPAERTQRNAAHSDEAQGKPAADTERAVKSARIAIRELRRPLTVPRAHFLLRLAAPRFRLT